MNVSFDWNEWFFILTTTIVFALFLFIRNYFHSVIVIMIWVYNVVYVSTIDYFLLATPFKLYFFGDNRTYELSGALFHLFMYPCASLIFLFAYDRWELYGQKTIWYILFWTGFSIFFEWLCIKNDVLTYTGWKIYYSIPTYPISALFLIILYRFIKNRLQELHSGI
ncbi:hypothetical protein [Bacillus sp. NEB1478]|uniref:hypothetical protein n=1 Tax=Bacillus sp. NEB1478 TaxID=3073816 RepID=UPI002873C326|nr:hypothetical protein [Bacillus sp. NEB1478]WNB93368.1 hypothetical protein RGB74_06785 [Bacillus sp. NEB1478]